MKQFMFVLLEEFDVETTDYLTKTFNKIRKHLVNSDVPSVGGSVVLYNDEANDIKNLTEKANNNADKRAGLLFEQIVRTNSEEELNKVYEKLAKAIKDEGKTDE